MPPESNDAPTRKARLLHAIDHVAHYLPAQAPLEVFVHHNTLHAFEDLPFYEALDAAGEKFLAEGLLPEKKYRAAFREGRITADDVDTALDDLAPTLPRMPEGFATARTLAKHALLHGIGPLSAAELRWQLTEHGASRRFQEGTSPVTRNRLIVETNLWIREALLTKQAAQVAALVFAPDESNGAQLSEPHLSRRASAAELWQLLEQDGEAVAVGALWAACREVTAGLDRARPAEKTEAPRFHRDWALALRQDDPVDRVHAILVPACGAFLDRGQARWAMPGRDEGFFVAWRRILTAGRAVRPSWLARLGKRLRDWERRGVNATSAVLELLDELGVADDEVDAFIEHTLLLLPGWAGMFRRLENAPGPVGQGAVEVRLVDFLAVRLTLDVLALHDVAARLHYRGPLARFREHAKTLPRSSGRSVSGEHDAAWPLFVLMQHAGVSAKRVRAGGAAAAEQLLGLLDTFGERERARVWHEAYEIHYRDEVLHALAENRPHRQTAASPRFQVAFCMDDRSESIRRHFEELSETHATFGTAGFFNLAIAYQGIDDPTTFPLCPVVVQPRHRIREDVAQEHAHLAVARRERRRRWGAIAERFHHASRSLFWGPLVTAMTGLVVALPLLSSVFAPWAAGRLRRIVERRLLPELKTRLTLPREHGRDEDETGALALGFTLEEKASRVGTLLENLGLTRNFAPIVALVGHDSSSVNNPHFAAYSCGACGGRSGGPNARLFARMANRPEVRERLQERGLSIPQGTVFLGGVHDTCTDRITLYDGDLEHDLAAERAEDLAALRQALGEALARNAHERARKFESAPHSPSPEQALRHVDGRAMDLSQARPELGHATNASCVVGRRALSSGIFLDRRAFLVSYDPETDEAGAVLERILLAVGPVGAGINLEYFFSTTDNERYGAGTKLPHNVTGYFGVMNGASSDLRTGLPKQMIEIHEPLRLQMVIETTPATLRAILERQPSLRSLIMNEWVRVATIDPSTGAIATLHPGRGFSPWIGNAAGPLPVVSRSCVQYSGQMGLVPPARIAAATNGEIVNAQ